jgi:hypothetical protein
MSLRAPTIRVNLSSRARDTSMAAAIRFPANDFSDQSKTANQKSMAAYSSNAARRLYCPLPMSMTAIVPKMILKSIINRRNGDVRCAA